MVSRQQLSTLSVDELRQTITWANEYLDKRYNERKKELWGNVAAAIKNYQEEIREEIAIDLDGGADEGYFRLEETAEHPGILYVGILN